MSIWHFRFCASMAIACFVALPYYQHAYGQLSGPGQRATFISDLKAYATFGDGPNHGHVYDGSSEERTGFNIDATFSNQLVGEVYNSEWNGVGYTITNRASATVNANGTIKTDNFVLKVDATADLTASGTSEGIARLHHNGVHSRIIGNINTTDFFILQAQANGTFPANWTAGYLLNYKLHGEYNNTGGVTDSRIGFRINSEVLSYDSLFGGGSINAFLSAHSSWGNNMGSPINQSLNFGFNVNFDGQTLFERGLLNFGNTIELESITFMDGTTPESHGLDIVFASGRTSPNLIPRTGDLDSDGDVDGADFLFWQRNDSTANRLEAWENTYGDTASFVAKSSIIVPEPTTMGLLLLTPIWMLCWQRKGNFIIRRGK